MDMNRNLKTSLLALTVLLAAAAWPAEETEEQKAPEEQRPPRELTVALLQMDAIGTDQQANLEKAERFCRQAAEQGTDIALMPEMWNIGYARFNPDKEGARDRFWSLAVPRDGEWVQHFAQLADELDMAIAVTYEQKWDPLPRNTVTLFDHNGKEVLTYAKVHTCDFIETEAAMTPGDGFHVATLTTDAGPVEIGLMICYDREHPESARVLMLKGAEIILTPNACTLEEMRLDQFKIRAWENAVGVAMANYAKPDQNGHSVAFDPEGRRLVEAGEEEGIFLARFNLDALRKVRGQTIMGNAFRRPHRYRELISTEKDEVWKRANRYGEPFVAEER
jgi:predicted amidohydrolase